MLTNGTGEPKHIIVIGTSAGGLNVLNELVGQLKKDWDAAFFIVLHLSRRGISDYLVHRLQAYTELHCLLGADDLRIQRGHVYIAPPAFHLMIEKGKVKLGRGPKENRWKPSIDVLFRSAAVAYQSRVTGIVLTGLLDDGTSGLWAVKRVGGTCIVQDPNEAQYPDMPLSVLNHMEVDYNVPVSEMGGVLDQIIQNKTFHDLPIPPDVLSEAELAGKMATGIEKAKEHTEQSPFTCPDCGGVLFELKDNNHFVKFRCHTGHSYSQNDLMVKISGNLESTLWVAVRMMEERRSLLKRMEAQTRERGFTRFANDHKRTAEELEQHISRMKEFMQAIQVNNDN